VTSKKKRKEKKTGIARPVLMAGNRRTLSADKTMGAEVLLAIV